MTGHESSIDHSEAIEEEAFVVVGECWPLHRATTRYMPNPTFKLSMHVDNVDNMIIGGVPKVVVCVGEQSLYTSIAHRLCVARLSERARGNFQPVSTDDRSDGHSHRRRCTEAGVECNCSCSHSLVVDDGFDSMHLGNTSDHEQHSYRMKGQSDGAAAGAVSDCVAVGAVSNCGRRYFSGHPYQILCIEYVGLSQAPQWSNSVPPGQNRRRRHLHDRWLHPHGLLASKPKYVGLQILTSRHKAGCLRALSRVYL